MTRAITSPLYYYSDSATRGMAHASVPSILGKTRNTLHYFTIDTFVMQCRGNSLVSVEIAMARAASSHTLFTDRRETNRKHEDGVPRSKYGVQ